MRKINIDLRDNRDENLFKLGMESNINRWIFFAPYDYKITFIGRYEFKTTKTVSKDPYYFTQRHKIIQQLIYTLDEAEQAHNTHCERIRVLDKLVTEERRKENEKVSGD